VRANRFHLKKCGTDAQTSINFLFFVGIFFINLMDNLSELTKEKILLLSGCAPLLQRDGGKEAGYMLLFDYSGNNI
jgi:hypothetical protein